MNALMVATPTWVSVVTGAGHRCQCGGVCGRSHDKTGGRCDRGLDRAIPDRLYAAPTNPQVPAEQAFRVPVEDLSAWCGGCLDRSRRLAAARRPHIPAVAPDSLFDLTAGGAA